MLQKTAVKLPTSTERVSDSNATKDEFKKECGKNILHIFKVTAQVQLLHHADCMLRNICPLGLSLHGNPDLQVQYNTLSGRMQTGFTPTQTVFMCLPTKQEVSCWHTETSWHTDSGLITWKDIC